MPRSGSGSRTSPGDASCTAAKGKRRVVHFGAPYLVPFTLVVAGVLALLLAWPRLASWGTSVESPETQIRKALADQDRAQLADVYGSRSGGTVDLHPVRFADVTPTIEDGRAVVVAMLSAEGRVAWRDEQATLAYIGRERFHMKECSIARWCGDGDQFDRLRGVLLALFRRHDAEQRRDPEAYGRLVAPDYRDRGEDRAEALRRIARELAHSTGAARIVGWQIRVERGGADVGEDAEVSAPGAVPRRDRHVYRLVRDGERWVFAAGI